MHGAFTVELHHVGKNFVGDLLSLRKEVADVADSGGCVFLAMHLCIDGVLKEASFLSD